MRKIIENPVYMTYEEIEKEFYGKWVFIANCVSNPYSKLLGGVPVAFADRKFEGHKDGFYDKFRGEEYAPRTTISFNYDKIPDITSIFMLPDWDGGGGSNIS